MRQLAVSDPIPHSWLEAFRRSHDARLMRIARALLAQDAEDGVQDAYERLSALRIDPAGTEDPEAFLWTVARRAVLDAHRRLRRRDVERTLDERLDGDTLEHFARAPLDEGPSTTAGRNELHAILRRELESLPAVVREALVLRDVEGLRYAEIAEVCGVPLGTIKSRIAAGTAELARRLRHWQEEDR